MVLWSNFFCWDVQWLMAKLCYTHTCIVYSLHVQWSTSFGMLCSFCVQPVCIIGNDWRPILFSRFLSKASFILSFLAKSHLSSLMPYLFLILFFQKKYVSLPHILCVWSLIFFLIREMDVVVWIKEHIFWVMSIIVFRNILGCFNAIFIVKFFILYGRHSYQSS